ncbi:oxidoreductase-like domain-containing protein 1 [Copidosoma floridanum]|uniref:oxidoreductase-like domain-containing protein 1 n=1 Tax=Copidosoma floridanum TaxID=29053 RepID=UPI0006C9BABE|nr:oxidoreductase-like domain-containing protein 1 [Copidosoma floridanum]XP_014205722.1 oxidoreductase-like domain-containing protein 1 [Copidosoma floridanum]
MTKLQHLRPLLLRTSAQFHYKNRLMSRMSPDQESRDKSSIPRDKKKTERPMYTPESPTSLEDIVEPTNCCMSGCANCVWIEYAEKLSEFLKDSPGDIQKLIMDKIQDPNMRAFLSMELRLRKIIE